VGARVFALAVLPIRSRAELGTGDAAGLPPAWAPGWLVVTEAGFLRRGSAFVRAAFPSVAAFAPDCSAFAAALAVAFEGRPEADSVAWAEPLAARLSLRRWGRCRGGLEMTPPPLEADPDRPLGFSSSAIAQHHRAS